LVVGADVLVDGVEVVGDVGAVVVVVSSATLVLSPPVVIPLVPRLRQNLTILRPSRVCGSVESASQSRKRPADASADR